MFATPKRILIVSRQKFLDLHKNKMFPSHSILISISTTEEEMVEIVQKVAKELEPTVAMYLFSFADLAPTDLQKSLPDTQLFCETDAVAILELAQRITEETTVIVHCDAGICRSGAVGEFIADVTSYDRLQFVRDNPHILPNIHVKSVLWNTYYSLL